MTIIRPETLVRWHRAGFRCYWRWKSRPFGGRPQIDADLGALIRRMSVENLLWDAPRIHGELLQAEHLNAGTACPGSTSTKLKSPQRPHCRLIFIGSLTIGVVTCASALMPCALSSALVMGGCRGLGLNGAMVPLVLCRQYMCSPEQPLYSPRW